MSGSGVGSFLKKDCHLEAMATDSTKTVACDNSAALAALAAQVVRLEEENRALLKENKCLRDSLLLLGGEGARQGPGTSATVNEERDEDLNNNEDLKKLIEETDKLWV